MGKLSAYRLTILFRDTSEMVTPRKWTEIRIRTTPETEDIISNFLFEIGCTGCQSDEDGLKAYFDESVSSFKIVEKLKAYLSELSKLGFDVSGHDIDVEILNNRDWNAEWKKTLKPIHVFPDVIIKPSWIELTPPENALIIKMDPKMAFGTGTHATTQLMMKLMRSKVERAKRVLDIGTGSGILSILAVQLFHCRVVAFDIDPIAVSTAKENFIENEVIDSVQLFAGTIDSLKKSRFDVILANINRIEIEKLVPGFKELINPGGVVILSGILTEEEELILKSLNRLNYNSKMKSIQEEWLGLALQMPV
ncbi:50S ribosomal protein L11 methyltransferase [candidate division KSB1 bacterium]|nr:50S ribosomal protein L11 methyltransferase [candidate division KSB1 bacterium]